MSRYTAVDYAQMMDEQEQQQQAKQAEMSPD